jgi:hypothetical protein
MSSSLRRLSVRQWRTAKSGERTHHVKVMATIKMRRQKRTRNPVVLISLGVRTDKRKEPGKIASEGSAIERARKRKG